MVDVWRRFPSEEAAGEEFESHFSPPDVSDMMSTSQDSGEEREGESASKPLDPGIQAQLGSDDPPHPFPPPGCL